MAKPLYETGFNWSPGRGVLGYTEVYRRGLPVGPPSRGDGDHGLAAAGLVRPASRHEFETVTDSRRLGMRIHWGATCLMFSLTVGLLGCGSYSAPNNPPTSPDSTRDTMPPPAYSR
jgi:hypothetical protein